MKSLEGAKKLYFTYLGYVHSDKAEDTWNSLSDSMQSKWINTWKGAVNLIAEDTQTYAKGIEVGRRQILDVIDNRIEFLEDLKGACKDGKTNL